MNIGQKFRFAPKQDIADDVTYEIIIMDWEKKLSVPGKPACIYRISSDWNRLNIILEKDIPKPIGTPFKDLPIGTMAVSLSTGNEFVKGPDGMAIYPGWSVKHYVDPNCLCKILGKAQMVYQ